MINARPWRTLIVLVLIAGAAQLVSAGLTWLQPSAPAARVAEVDSLADPHAPLLGAPSADVTIYLFSDYACPACRAMHGDLRALVAQDSGVRIIYRDWPVFGPRSERAARLAIASTWQARHAAFDDELMRHGGGLDDAALRTAAARAGVDWSRLMADAARHSVAIDALIAASRRHARESGFVGTPTLIVGPYLVNGRQSAVRLRALVNDARGAR